MRRFAALAALCIAAAAIPVLGANLLGAERSPYLRESASSAIHWRPWTEGALADARANGRLVFLSIGYSSCHWCRVMARESFADAGIAEALNAGYVSLKVDGEEMPALEQRFLAALEALGVSPGWPMTFILTPDEGVVWGNTYVDRATLAATLGRISERWATDRERVARLAAARPSRVAHASPAASDGPGAAEAFATASARVAADFDPEYKGFGRGQKFPPGADLALMLEAWTRGEGEGRGAMVVETARAIAGGGLRDPLDGGIFRYSTARDWLRPHFERMLYDQANTARLLCDAVAIEKDAGLSAAAADVLAFARRAFATRNGLLASAFAADSAGSEGGHFLWTRAELDRLPPRTRAAVRASLREATLDDGRVLLVTGSSRLAPALRDTLLAARAKRAPPPRDEKAITAWNANAAGALATCSLRLARPELAREGATLMRRLLALNVPAGTPRRYSLGDEALGEGSVDDYAWLLAALVALHDADGSREWIDHAAVLAASMMAREQSSFAREVAAFSADRGAPAASGVLLRALGELARRSPGKDFGPARARVREALAGLGQVAGHGTVAAAILDQDSPAPRVVAYAAAGNVRLGTTKLTRSASGDAFVLTARIAPGWHLNAAVPLQDYLRPTRILVRDRDDARVSYPPPRRMRLGSTGDELAVLDGAARFAVTLPAGAAPKAGAPLRLAAELQACNDQYCLRPETVELLANTR